AVAIACIDRASALDEQTNHFQIICRYCDMQCGVGDGIDLANTFRFLRNKRTDAADVALAYSLPDIPVVQRRAVPAMNGLFNALNNRMVSTFAQLFRPVLVHESVVLSGNLEGNRIRTRVE